MLERSPGVPTSYTFMDHRDYLSEMQRMMRSLLEGDILRGDVHISLTSTAAARELRDGHYVQLVSKLLGMGGELSRPNYPKSGF